jgi:hypothetical protein
MATWDDVDRFATALPETAVGTTYGQRAWKVKDKLFVWERPLRKSDVEALGERAPDGPILGARVADVGIKEALIADDPSVFFTTPHFNGYPAVLVELVKISVDELQELVTEAWIARAPKRLVNDFTAAARAD